jgi:hypothetical protein
MVSILPQRPTASRPFLLAADPDGLLQGDERIRKGIERNEAHLSTE